VNRYGPGRPATKAELVRIRLELSMAREGLSLLENKRDFLIKEGARQLGKAREKRLGLSRSWARLQEMWSDCLQMERRETLERLAAKVAKMPPLEGGERRWMSVSIAEYSQQGPKLALLGAFFDCGLRPERARGALAAMLPELVELMNLETNVRRIAMALKRCQRQVNALNYVILPELETEKKRIEQRLEEMEREALFQSKRLKARSH